MTHTFPTAILNLCACGGEQTACRCEPALGRATVQSLLGPIEFGLVAALLRRWLEL